MESGYFLKVDKIKFQIPKWNEHKLPNGKLQWVSVEIALLNRITFHPNIIPMYEWFDQGDEFVLIFQRPNKHVDFFGELGVIFHWGLISPGSNFIGVKFQGSHLGLNSWLLTQTGYFRANFTLGL